MKRLFLFTLLFPVFVIASPAQHQPRVWILFNSRSAISQKEFRASDFSRASVKRRHLRSETSWDQSDLPVSSDYVAQLRKSGATIYRESRWLNGVSAYCDKKCRAAVSQLSFVAEIRPVLAYHRHPEPISRPFEISDAEQTLRKLRYGKSQPQLTQIGVPPAHQHGFAGQGEIVAIFDSGFLKTHIAFRNHTVVAEKDFVFNDDNVDDGKGFDSHGTGTWSCVNGEVPGKLYGPAFKASVLLAVTEDIRSETEVEEDNWIAALEWADQHGATVISSSLGYPSFYTPSQFDGRTAVISRAAATAARKGILVVNSAGNEGPGRNTVGPPADARKILAVGAVDSTGQIAFFSSRGPTADGRIKPEVDARGEATFLATDNTTTSFAYSSGTSFACPLVAGSAAVILSAHGDWTPLQVREALMKTASQGKHPDNDYGWGIINVEAALDYLPKKSIVIEHTPLKNVGAGSDPVPVVARIRAQRGLNQNALFLYWKSGASSFQSVSLTPISGQPDFYRGFIPRQASGTTVSYYLSAKDKKGKIGRLPFDAPQTTFTFRFR